MCFDLIKRAVEMYPVFNYGLSTNGMLFNEEKMEFFKVHKNFVMVQFSLDGTPETQMKNRGAVPDYNLMRTAMKEIQATVRMVADDPDLIKESIAFLVHDLGAKDIKVGIPIFKANRPTYKEEFMEQLEAAQAEFPHIKIEGDKMSCEKTCYAVDNHIAISPTGNIYPCDIFYFKGMYKFGDVVNGIDQEKVVAFQKESQSGFDPAVPCLAHKMFMNDKWIN